MRDLRNKRGDCPIFGFVFIEWFRPRGYWCFGFKSFNKLLKAGAARSNWQREREHHYHEVLVALSCASVGFS